MKFTKASIARITVPAGRSELIVFDEDMPGFGLRLRAGGTAVWIAQYRVGAKQRRVTLGRTATLDPDRARAPHVRSWRRRTWVRTRRPSGANDRRRRR